MSRRITFMNSSIENIPKLHELFKEDFLIGAAVNPTTIQTQTDLISTHFNSITAENEMKFVSVHPKEDVYTFEDADKIVNFAREKGLKLRGHTLVWHNQTAEDWLFYNEDGSLTDKTTLLSRMKSHIDTVMNHFKEDVYCWDVVNEVIADEGKDLLRSSNWLKIAGPDFIAKAFEYAHEADPNVLLFYNDYNESNPEKREKIYTLVKTLMDQGTPIHGVGLQAHWNIVNPSLDHIRAGIERYAELGLKLQLTELDVSVFNHEDHRTDLKEPTEEMMTLQTERYEQFFSILKEYRDVITGVTFWGAADDYTWLDHFPVRGRKNWPFLFDDKHQPKSSFWKIAEAAKK